jgi:hypothetical protein
MAEVAQTAAASAGGGIAGHVASLLSCMARNVGVTPTGRRLAACAFVGGLQRSRRFCESAATHASTGQLLIPTLQHGIVDGELPFVEVVTVMCTVLPDLGDQLATLLPAIADLLANRGNTPIAQTAVVRALAALLQLRPACRVVLGGHPVAVAILVQLVTTRELRAVTGVALGIIYELASLPSNRLTLCTTPGIGALPTAMASLHAMAATQIACAGATAETDTVQRAMARLTHIQVRLTAMLDDHAHVFGTPLL